MKRLILSGLGLVSGAVLAGTPPATINFGWTPSPSPATNVAGYNLYWGPAAGSYTNHVFIPGAATTNGSVGSLPWGAPYYFNISVVGTNGAQGLESVFDGEVATNLPPLPLPATGLHVVTGP